MIKNLVGLAVGSMVWLWFAVIVATHLANIGSMAAWELNTDFYKFWSSAVGATEGASAYVELNPSSSLADLCPQKPGWMLVEQLQQVNSQYRAPLGAARCIHPNLNPPFFVALMYPLTFLDYSAAWWGWSLASLIAGIAAVWMLVATAPIENPWRRVNLTVLISAAMLSWTPALINSQLGQISLFLLALLTWAYLLFVRGRAFWCGVVLGLGAGTKLFLLLFLITLPLGNYNSVFRGFVVGFLASLFVGWLVLGSQGYMDYVYVARFVDWGDFSWNASLPGMMDRTWGYFVGWHGLESRVPLVLVLTVCGALLVSGLWLCRHVNNAVCSPILRFEILFSLTLILALLLSPLGWNYYFLLLLFPFWLTVRRFFPLPCTRIHAIGTVFFILVAAVPVPLFALEWTDVTIIEFVYTSANFLALLVYYGLFASLVARVATTGDLGTTPGRTDKPPLCKIKHNT